jgi:SRSO17 transposase
VTKKEHQAAADASIAASSIDSEIEHTCHTVEGAFKRTGTYLQFKKYVKAVASNLEKRNAWTIAKYVGDRNPFKCQRLLNTNVWDEDEVLYESRTRTIEQLRAAAPRRALTIFAFDETGQEKSGDKTAGVKRQYMGCAGQVANGINTVHMSFNIEGTGHAIINARQWIPSEHIEDEKTAEQAGLPEDIVFKTKGQLAAEMFIQVHDEGHRSDFVVGDEVYGSSPDLREAAEARGQGYVLRVPSNYAFTTQAGTVITARQAVKKFLKGKKRWTVDSCGDGSKGARLYAWAWVATDSPRHHIVVRRHLSKGECDYYYCHVPEGRPARLKDLITAAGLRWPVEECFEFGKDYFGLDQSQVRVYRAIKRYTIIVIVVLGIFAVTAAEMRRKTDTLAPPPTSDREPRPTGFGLIPLTVGEIKTVYNGFHDTKESRAQVLHWSWWRRRHQAEARWYHIRTRLGRPVEFAQLKL